MSNTPKCSLFRLLLAPIAIAMLELLLLGTVWATDRTIYVSPPNGVDDTANLQSALNACVAQGPNCTVQLAAGTYLTSQLVTYNFHGTFKGMGQNQTTVEALPNLPVSFPDVLNGECQPNTTDCLWPSLIIFVDGDISISDMTITVPAVPSTQPWLIFGSTFTALIDVVRIMGQHRTNADLERLTLEGMPDNSPTSFFGFNVLNGMLYAGELPRSRTPFDYYFLSGKLSVSNCSFKSTYDGPGMDGFMTDSHIVFGGSPSAANVYENVAVPVFPDIIENSIVDISYNVGPALAVGLLVEPWLPAFIPTKPSLFLIHDNSFQVAGPSTNGIYLLDDPNHQALSALVFHNTIEANDTTTDAVAAWFTTGTTILNNKISGTGPDAIGIYGGTYASVLRNDVTSFTANYASGLAQIVLDGSLFGLPDTSQSTAVCKTPSDTVLNLGVDNKIIGCQETASSSARASKMIPRPKVLTKKPFLR